MDNSINFEGFFDPEKLAEILARDKQELANRIRSHVRDRILKIDPKTCVSFALYKGDSLHRYEDMRASVDYAKVLIAFMREREYEGYRVESQITPLVLQAAEEAIIDFYSDEKIQKAVATELTRQISENEIIQAALKADLAKDKAWLTHEFNTILAGKAGYSIAGQSIDALASSLSHFFSSAVGKSILVAIGKIMGTQTGHLLLRYIGTAVGKALASAAFRSAIVATIKKIGLGILVKTVIGKAIIALLALVGLGSIPVAWVLLPLIAGVLIYEYVNFPEKLAAKVPDNIADGILRNFDELNKSVSKNIISSVAAAFLEEMTKLKKK